MYNTDMCDDRDPTCFICASKIDSGETSSTHSIVDKCVNSDFQLEDYVKLTDIWCNTITILQKDSRDDLNWSLSTSNAMSMHDIKSLPSDVVLCHSECFNFLRAKHQHEEREVVPISQFLCELGELKRALPKINHSELVRPWCRRMGDAPPVHLIGVSTNDSKISQALFVRDFLTTTLSERPKDARRTTKEWADNTMLPITPHVTQPPMVKVQNVQLFDLPNEILRMIIQQIPLKERHIVREALPFLAVIDPGPRWLKTLCICDPLYSIFSEDMIIHHVLESPSDSLLNPNAICEDYWGRNMAVKLEEFLEAHAKPRFILDKLCGEVLCKLSALRASGNARPGKIINSAVNDMTQRLASYKSVNKLRFLRNEIDRHMHPINAEPFTNFTTEIETFGWDTQTAVNAYLVEFPEGIKEVRQVTFSFHQDEIIKTSTEDGFPYHEVNGHFGYGNHHLLGIRFHLNNEKYKDLGYCKSTLNMSHQENFRMSINSIRSTPKFDKGNWLSGIILRYGKSGRRYDKGPYNVYNATVVISNGNTKSYWNHFSVDGSESTYRVGKHKGKHTFRFAQDEPTALSMVCTAGCRIVSAELWTKN